jgi:hypothetical protein
MTAEIGTAARVSDTGERQPAASVEAGTPGARTFFLFGTAVMLVVTALLVGLSLWRNDGHLVFVIDDAAIHLSMIENLAFEGTWGVVPGTYASASSAPGWELLLVGPAKVLPVIPLESMALLVNVAASIWILWLLAREATFLRPREREWLAYLLIVLVAVIALFLPSLALVGMEHVLHAAIVLQALILLGRVLTGRDTRRDVRTYLGLLLVGSLFRFETVFVAAGAAVALVAITLPRLAPQDTSARLARPKALRLGGLSLVAAGLPVVAFGLVNKAFGLGFVPASIASKAAREFKHRIGPFRTPAGAIDLLKNDLLLFVLLLALVVYLVVALSGGPRANAGLAITFVLAVVLHAVVADVGYFERYQAYLLVAGVYVGLLVLAEVVPGRARTGVLALLVLAIPVFGSPKVGLAFDTHRASSNTYRQRYQMARFLERYYDGRPVATGELGYVTYFHDGPVTDILGIGDPEVLGELEEEDGFLSPSFVGDLVRRRDVDVIAVYPGTLAFSKPESWIFAGRWTLTEKKVTAFERDLEFYAPDLEALGELDRNLQAFEDELPDGVDYTSLDEALEFIERAERKERSGN